MGSIENFEIPEEVVKSMSNDARLGYRLCVALVHGR